MTLTTSTTYRDPERGAYPPGMPQDPAKTPAQDANDARLMPLHQPGDKAPWWSFLCWKRHVKS